MDINQCPRCKTRFRGVLVACPIDGETLIRVDDPLLGRTIAGRYVLEDKLGGGGMGVVYRGRHQVIDREVAIKFLHPRFTRDPTSRKRFLGEARAANQINHENIIDITDFGETEDGLVYLVMEYLQGRSLDRDIGKRPMVAQRALRIAVQIAGGLARAHELDVIHRDVKPGNVFLLRRRGDPDFVKLLDFGIARFEREMRITDRGILMGTPEYMAPEQIQSSAATASSDLYALGCVLYEMLTGEAPFTGVMSEVLIKQMRETPAPPSKHVPGLHPGIDAVVMRLLSKDPEKRHRDAFHLVDDLQALLDQVPVARASEVIGRATPPAAQPISQPVSPAEKPTMHVPSEHEEWQSRVQAYREQLARTHAASEIPAEQRAALARMVATLARVQALRGEVDASVRSLTTHEDDVRATRMRIGRALDELVHDESKHARALDAGKREHALAEGALRDVVRAIAGRGPARLPSKRAGDVLSAHDAQLLTAVAAQLDALAEAEAHVTQLHKQLAERRSAWDDVRFQIAQLKGRLALLNADSSASTTQTQERVQKHELELRTAIEALVSDAEVIASHLRERPGQADTQRALRAR